MTRSLHPTRLDWTAIRASQLTTKRRYALFRGDTYTDEGVIVDGDGNPIELGPPDDPYFSFLSQIRDGRAQDGGRLLCTLTVEVVSADGADGLVRWSAAGADTRTIDVTRGFWDLQVTNLSHPDFEVDWVATAFEASVLFAGHVSDG